MTRANAEIPVREPDADELGYCVIAAVARDRLRPLPLVAQEKDDPSRLTVERIFGRDEFEPEHVCVRWIEGLTAT